MVYDISGIHPRYLDQSIDAQAQKVNNLYCTPAPQPGFYQANIVNPSQQAISLSEKRIVLMRECATFVDLLLSERAYSDAFEQAFRLMQDLKIQVKQTGQLNITLTTSTQHSAARRTQHSAAAPEPANSDNGSSSTPAMASEVRVASKDEQDLFESLGLTGRLAPVPNNMPGLLGKQIAFKTQALRRGGWFVGTVTRVFDPTLEQPGEDITRRPANAPYVNALVHYPQSDDKCEAHMLTLDNMVTDANASIHSWGLVEAQDLSNYGSAANVLNPSAACVGRQKSGRPQTTRQGPASGPCANAAGAKRQRAAASAHGNAAGQHSTPSKAPTGPAAGSPSGRSSEH